MTLNQNQKNTGPSKTRPKTETEKALLEEFFKDNNVYVDFIDRMARRYGKLPHEIMNVSVFEWNFNVAVMGVGIIEENKRVEASNDKAQGKSGGLKMGGPKDKWAGMGINRTVVKKGGDK